MNIFKRKPVVNEAPEPAVSPRYLKDEISESAFKHILSNKILVFWGYTNGPFLQPVKEELSNTRKKEIRSHNIKKSYKYQRAVEHAERLAAMAWTTLEDLKDLGEK